MNVGRVPTEKGGNSGEKSREYRDRRMCSDGFLYFERKSDCGSGGYSARCVQNSSVTADGRRHKRNSGNDASVAYDPKRVLRTFCRRDGFIFRGSGFDHKWGRLIPSRHSASRTFIWSIFDSDHRKLLQRTMSTSQKISSIFIETRLK